MEQENNENNWRLQIRYTILFALNNQRNYLIDVAQMSHLLTVYMCFCESKHLNSIRPEVLVNTNIL